MEYRYYRELKHNYLIVQQDNNSREKIASYQARILEKGKLSGFLTCNMRTINNENYLYYEINSMQNIRDRFSVRGMDAEQLAKLLTSLKNSLESLSEYLLGMENVVLDAKSVFTDLSTGEFKFMYCPFKKEQADFAGFIDELVELVDHDDEVAVEMIYSCAEKAEMDSMLAIDCIEQVLEDKRYVKEPIEKIEQSQDTQEFIEFDNRALNLDEDEEEENEDIRKHKGQKASGKVQIIFGILFLILLAIMMYVRMNYILSREENLLSIIVIVVSVVTGLVAFINGFKDANVSLSWKKKNKNKKDIKSLEDMDEDDTCDQLEDYGEFCGDDTIDTYVDVDSYKNKVNVTAHSKRAKYAASTRSSWGETVVLSQEDDSDKAFTLYSRNTDKTIRISLDKLPLTVGKMAGCVDEVLDDMSVSRIHCRFMQNEEGGISIVDLNSTNGTFRNGLKITPQKEIGLEEGDEVRIGRICFDCR